MKKTFEGKKIPKDLWETLSPEFTQSRREKIEKISAHRTDRICLVLQDVANEHNICACLRSAEAFGVQDIYVVNENKNYRLSTVAKGSSSWLSIHNFKTIVECASYLKKKGFLLAAAVPHQESVPLNDLKLNKPLAVLFGNEHSGLSEEWRDHVDCYFTIPMFGFVESLNISVGAAITMQFLTNLGRSTEPDFYLKSEERKSLLNTWAAEKVPHAYKKYMRLKGLD